ncbi:hypothetical protein E2C01_022565 [Portunus trituberculatus]|uniref:Uncharacterized protein n=1 Tax=Portunus trituberculatus TaxID=210409 RepID=A0A5B7E7M2_PORTR|nr:hypothetical protein [Portunus trituberculatus]
MTSIQCGIDAANAQSTKSAWFDYSSKSLIGDSSVLFSPPSIIRDTLPEETHPLNSPSILPDKTTKKAKSNKKVQLDVSPRAGSRELAKRLE